MTIRAPFEFHTCLAGSPAFEACRQLVARQMDQRYSGWSDDYDRRFDPATVFTYLSSDRGRTPLATMKFVLRDRLVGDSRLVCERAPQGALDASGYRVEGAGVAIASMRAGRLMGPAAMHWALGHGWGNIVSSYEATNRATRKIYLRTYEMKPIDCEPFRFPDLRLRDSGQVADWVPVRDEASTRHERLYRLFPNIEQQVDPRPALDCRETALWMMTDDMREPAAR